jgi:hypothetical protein
VSSSFDELLPPEPQYVQRDRAGTTEAPGAPAGRATTSADRTELPLCLVYGSCQADAIRALLEASPAFRTAYRTEHIPAVQEVTDSTLPELRQAVSRASLMVSQNVRDGYHGLPVGSDEMFELAPSGCRRVSIPSLYYEGLFPFQVYVRDGRRVADAPWSVYHDLRFLYCAGKGWSDSAALRWFRTFDPAPDAVRAIADQAQAVLRAHEVRLDVKVAERLVASDMHGRSFFTVNHPTNAALLEVVAGVHDALQIPYARPEIGGELLGFLRTPLEPSTIDALELEMSPRAWVINGHPYSLEDLLVLHLAWYRDHAELVTPALSEYETRMRTLGLAP